MENCLANCATGLVSKYLKLLQKIRMTILALLLKVVPAGVGNAAKAAAETVSGRAVCWWAVMWQEAPSNCLGQALDFLHFLCVTESELWCYQPLKNTCYCLLLKALLCFRASLCPLHWCHCWCTVLLWLQMSAGFTPESSPIRKICFCRRFRSFIASLKLRGKFEVWIFVLSILVFFAFFPSLLLLHPIIALFESFLWLLNQLPQDKQYISQLWEWSFLLISHFSDRKTSVSSASVVLPGTELQNAVFQPIIKTTKAGPP